MSMYGIPSGGPPDGMTNMRARLRPMGIGDILDETFRLYRENFTLFVATVAVLEVPAQIINILITASAPSSNLQFQPGQTSLSSSQVSKAFASAAATGGGSIIVSLASTIIAAAMAVVISHCYLNRPVTTGDAYRATMNRLGSLLLTVIWAAIRLILMAVTIIGIPFAIYYGVSWALMSQVVMLENRGGTDATRRSRELVRGFWWKTLGLLVVVAILLAILVSIPGIIIGAIIGTTSQPFTARLLVGIFALLVSLLTTPIQVAATTLLFYDLKIRKEAFDLEAMVQQASFSAPPSQY